MTKDLFINVLVEKDGMQFWLILPTNEKQLPEKIGQLGEYRIVNYETNIQSLNLDDTTDLVLLNDFFSNMRNNFNNWDDGFYMIIQAAIIYHDSVNHVLEKYTDLESFVSIYDSSYLYDNCTNMTEKAHISVLGKFDYYFEESSHINSFYNDVDMNKYFDFERYGKDLAKQGTFIFLENGYCVELVEY